MKLAAVVVLAVGAPAAADDAVPVFAGPGAWTTEILDRPLTLKRGMIGGGLDLALSRTVVTDIEGAVSSVTTEAAAVSARYGIVDRVEVDASYGLTLHDFEAKGPLAVRVIGGVVSDERLKLAGAAGYDYDLASEIGAVRGGIAFQIAITPRLAVFGPPAQVRVTTAVPIRAGAKVPKPVDIALPVGLALQGSEHVFASLQTSLVTVGISDSDTAVIFADATPVTASVYYSPSNRLDLGVVVDAPNLPDIGDVFAVTLSARLFVR